MTWKREDAIAALRAWSESNGLRTPAAPTDWRPAPAGCPSEEALRRMFGSWNEAMRAAGLAPNTRYVSNLRDDESMLLQLRVDAGETLVEVAADVGITPQALGRRLARYRSRHPEYNHRVPQVANRNPLRHADDRKLVR